MFCMNCGFKNQPGDQFCAKCGAPLIAAVPQTWQCANCGQVNPIDANFCGSCGAPQPAPATAQPGAAAQPAGPKQNLFKAATHKLASYAGEDVDLDINLRNLFSQVTKKHTTAEAEQIFIAGTPETTPTIGELSADWGRPWLFSRIFAAFAIVFALLYIMLTQLQNEPEMGGIIMVGAFAVPFSGLVLFFELNAYHNISIYNVMKIFFVGGALSLLVTLVLYLVVPGAELNSFSLANALGIGFTEELGKALIVAYFVRQLNAKTILNGVLIGAGVGAGFAVFETMGYDLNSANSVASLLSEVFLRAWSAPGGHLVWAAIEGGGLLAAKRAKPFAWSQLVSGKFLPFFVISWALHAMWDWRETFGLGDTIKYIVLIVIAWIVVFTLIAAGLKELRRLQTEAQQAA